MEVPTFDYIIVGGGNAASVLTSRLSHALPNASILLIEAGPATDPHLLPAIGFILSDGTKRQWNNRSVPQKGLDGKTVGQVQGRVLGGGSAINYTTWTRGAKGEFDQWAKEVGDDRWSWEGLLPYFKKSERFIPGTSMPQSPQPGHGYEGPITVSHVSSCGKPRNYPLKSMVEDIYSTAGVHRIEDMNSGKSIGVAEYATSTFNGERQFGAVCYPRGRNVTLWTDTTAARLIIEGTRVTGVELMENERGVHQARAKREVIVTCGAQGSPKLLLLSGIGPKTELKKHGIKQVADLPVGANYSDHPILSTFWKLKERDLSFGDMEMVTPDCDWTAGTPCDFLAFHRHDTPAIKSLTKDLLTAQDIERFNVNGRPHTESFVLYGHIDLSGTVPNPGGSAISVFNILVGPTSVGSITLSSSDPDAPLLLDPALFGNEVDKKLVYESARLIVSAIQSSPVAAKYGVEEYNVSEEIKGRVDDEAMYERLVKTAETANHGSGTCAMGKVVDTECKVKGVDGLRVADSSVFPFAIGAHYQAIVYALAELVADMILKSA